MAVGFTCNIGSSVRAFLIFYFSFEIIIVRDCYRDCASRNLWGNLRIKLFDTTFWQKMSQEPDRYRDGWMTKNNLLECDFAVLPIFEL
jgi:hypothetical protein